MEEIRSEYILNYLISETQYMNVQSVSLMKK